MSSGYGAEDNLGYSHSNTWDDPYKNDGDNH